MAWTYALVAVIMAWAMIAALGCDAPAIEITTPTIAVQEEQEGTGRAVSAGDVVTINYVVRLPDGDEVLRDRGFRFELGRGAVIEGIDMAVEGMRVGGRRVVACPPNRHWGRQGYADGKIPPNTTLTLDVELVAVR